MKSYLLLFVSQISHLILLYKLVCGHFVLSSLNFVNKLMNFIKELCFALNKVGGRGGERKRGEERVKGNRYL